MMAALLVAATAFLVSLAGCWLMVRVGPRDAPDGARKLQVRPVPSAGGAGIFAGLLVAGGLAWALLPADRAAQLAERLGPEGTGPLLAYVLLAAGLGFADDRYGLPALPKLIVLAGGALLAARFGTPVETLWLPFGAGDVGVPRGLSIVIVALWLLVMTNAVNFMDGANGIAMGASAIMLAAIALVLLPEAIYGAADEGAGALVALASLAACAIGGFLVWNIPGRLYAGDTGALGIGALLGALGVVCAGQSIVWVAPAFMLPFLVDVLMTLAWRARAGRALMTAHRDHAYQLLLRAGWSHFQVARLWWGLSGACAAVMLGGPFAGMIGLLPTGIHPADVAVAAFFALLLTGCATWSWQRVTLGRRLAAAGR